MNSLPFISHHLFVAPIGNVGREHEQPASHERLPIVPGDQPSAITLEVMDARGRMPESENRALQPRMSEALS